MKLPKPICQFGYSEAQIDEIFGLEKSSFLYWMGGQTFSKCEGFIYSFKTKRQEPTGCGPHGIVYNTWDVQRYATKLPNYD